MVEAGKVLRSEDGPGESAFEPAARWLWQGSGAAALSAGVIHILDDT